MNAEKSSYGWFERFLYLFLIPIVFTLILTTVLLSLFNYDVKNTFLKVGGSIPLVGKMLPEPKADSYSLGSEDKPAGDIGYRETAVQLEEELKVKEAEIAALLAASEQREAKIKALEAEIAQLEGTQSAQTLDEEQYQEQIRSLASMYAMMTPSKAAKVLSNLTIPELVLVISEMKPEEQVKVLEKMDPKIAADASIRLKDLVPAKDKQIAALQARLGIQEQEKTNDSGQ